MRQELGMEYRQLGKSGLRVSTLTLGTMTFGGRGWAEVVGTTDVDGAKRQIGLAIDAGINLIDTADAYALDGSEVGHNERLIAKALKGRREDVIVATKGVHTREGSAWLLDGRPEHVREACEASLKALETDRIDLYQFHRPDPDVPFAETVGAFKELQDEGKIRWIGLSNVNNEQLDEALEIAPIVAVQNQLALNFTSPLTKGEVQAATDRGIAFLPWSPLGGMGKADETSAGVAEVREIAAAHGVSPQQVVLAWLLHLGPTVIPIPGARRPETIIDSAAAARLELADDEVNAITRAVTTQ
jgi:aryl-alcohol dehydrogenase-like predicted oxidoreductase